MVPLPFDKLPIIEPLVAARLVEARLGDRADIESCMDTIALGYRSMTIAAYVDSTDDPKRCLLLMIHPNIFNKQKSVSIILMYIDPSVRGDSSIAKSMFGIAESFAKHHGASQLYCGSWIYRGCKDIGKLLRANDFEEQDVKYVKQL